MVTSVKMQVEMQTPSQTVTLDLDPDDDDAVKTGTQPGQSLQKTVGFDLREEGTHVLAVSITYSETIHSQAEKSASGGRVRTFRKLYQFLAQPCLSVRTKASDLPARQDLVPALSRYALEAQLENLADGPITLEELIFEAKMPFVSTSLNWDVAEPDIKDVELPTLIPRDITQVAYLIEEQHDKLERIAKELTADGRTILGVLTIRWRSAMGDPGVLSTGWLTSRRK